MPDFTSAPLLLLLTAALAYLLGSIPFGIVITRALGLGDLRQIGSGNIGATNVLRTGNKPAALATLVLDAGKGGIAVLKGTLAPNGAIIKQSAAAPHLMKHEGRAVVFESLEDMAARLDDPERRQRLMAIIIDDVARLNRLITDISDASRVDAELSREDRGPIDIAQALSALAEVYAATAEERGGPAVLAEVEEGVDLVVAGQEGRLIQVLRNLVENARSFSPPNGTVRLQARQDGTAIVISVEDDGPGLPDGKLEAVFDRFYSERPEGEKFGTHSGLGLSISKQIIEAHDGLIRAENRRSASGDVIGARFIVRLPSTPARA